MKIRSPFMILRKAKPSACARLRYINIYPHTVFPSGLFHLHRQMVHSMVVYRRAWQPLTSWEQQDGSEASLEQHSRDTEAHSVRPLLVHQLELEVVLPLTAFEPQGSLQVQTDTMSFEY